MVSVPYNILLYNKPHWHRYAVLNYIRAYYATNKNNYQYNITTNLNDARTVFTQANVFSKINKVKQKVKLLRNCSGQGLPRWCSAPAAA